MMPQKTVCGRFLVPVLAVVMIFGLAKYLCCAETGSSPATSESPGALSSAATVKDEEYRIQADDILMIDGHRHAELNPLREYLVRKDGTINVVHLGSVPAAGLTERELEEKLAKLYDPKFFKNLVISVAVKSKTYDIGGEVRNPGIKQLTLKTTVLKAILSAGGPTDYAALDKVTVSRMVGGKTIYQRINCQDIIKGRAADDFLIQPNDTIWVPQSRGFLGL